MPCDQSRDARGSDDSRLVYGWSGGRRLGPRRTAAAITTARHVDEALAYLRLARPTVLVSGFWRSGTTWLQECLAATLGGKTIFEPLSPMEPLRRTALFGLHPSDSEDLRQATIPGPLAAGSPVWRYLDRTCTGRLATPYLLSCRRRATESFRRAIIVKDVRLQANLAAFHRRYRVPVIHMRRHPCAVVASLRAAHWHWSFARAPLATLLPRLAPAISPIELANALRFDADAISRTAALWAITERLAAATLDRQPWGIVMPYETFAEQPEAILAQAGKLLGLRMLRRANFAAPSASIDPAAFAAYDTPARDRWRGLLSGAEIDQIEAIADAVYPGWRATPHAIP